MAGLRELPAMGVLYCLGAGWSQWRPLDIHGTHLPYSTMQLLNNIKTTLGSFPVQVTLSFIGKMCECLLYVTLKANLFIFYHS